MRCGPTPSTYIQMWRTGQGEERSGAGKELSAKIQKKTAPTGRLGTWDRRKCMFNSAVANCTAVPIEQGNAEHHEYINKLHLPGRTGT